MWPHKARKLAGFGKVVTTCTSIPAVCEPSSRVYTPGRPSVKNENCRCAEGDVASQSRNIFRVLLSVCVLALVAGLGMPERASAQTLTNADIVKMVQAKLGDDVIISEIKHSTCNFDTSPNALVKLKEAGVSDRVLEAMTEAAHSRAPGGASPSGGPNSGVPVPENFGIYAAAGGKLLGIDVPVSTMAPPTVSIRLWNDFQGVSVHGSWIHVQRVPVLPASVSFVNFGNRDAIGGDELLQAPYLGRSIEYGKPVTNVWLVSPSTPKGLPAIPLLERPMAGHADVDIFSPARPLGPGVYWLATVLPVKYLVFAVGQPADVEGTHCFDYLNWGFAPCARAPAAAPPGPTPGAASTPRPAPQGAASSPVSCGDYKSCLRAGFSAENARDWQTSIDDFHAAAMKSPSSPEPWTLLGGPYLQTGQIENFTQGWDKALKLGGNVGFDAWHQLAFHVERGGFQLNRSLVSFSLQNGEKVFAAAPSKVTVIGAYRTQGQAYLRLRISGRTYSIIPIPTGATCQAELTVECPAQAVTQQQILTRYIAQTIPKLASGAHTQ